MSRQSQFPGLMRNLRGLAKASLPPAVRRKAVGLARRLRMRRVTTWEGLEEELARVQKAFEQGEAAGRAAFDSFYFDPPRSLPADPSSSAYAAAQMELYRRISGREYSLANEASPFDLEAAKRSPFPYQTGLPEVIGEQLIAQGFLIQTMGLPPGSTVLEFGPGPGNTTLQFLQSGYRVTAVEIDEKFVEVIRHRCDGKGELTVVHSDMLSFRSADKFDAVVFFECFHHCADHVQLLRNVRGLLEPGGQLVLASEPIADFPDPWGVRLDGGSLWSMRRYGWLELGFDTEYLFSHLRNEGWNVTRRREPILGTIADVVIARPLG